MVKKQNSTNRPSFFRWVGEHIKVWKEVRTSDIYFKLHENMVEGDGHPVLVIPGFMASDLSTNRLRQFIEKIGYTPYSWDLGRNYGDVKYANALLEKIEKLADKHGTEVSLIGWSLGGIYARQLAKKKPELVRQVITLAAPFANINERNNATWLYNLLNDSKKISPEDEMWLEDMSSPTPVPATSLYSKQDGVLSWKACMEIEEDKLHQNIEVGGTHLGLGYNSKVWEIIENRLQYREENWERLKFID